MTDAIFLSAGVPDPKRGPRYAKTADTVAITAAVSALVHVTLGRRLLVWGGQPAITPMIWVIAEGLGVEYGGWVKLYQSKHFQDDYPEDNQRFQNVTYTDDVGNDREDSLRLMRERMFLDFNFTAAVFIGGMGGILQEFDLLQKLQPNVAPLPVISTGGAVLDVAQRMGNVPADLRTIWIMYLSFTDTLAFPLKRCVTGAQPSSRRRLLIGFGSTPSPAARHRRWRRFPREISGGGVVETIVISLGDISDSAPPVA